MSKLDILFLPSIIGPNDLGGGIHQHELITHLSKILNVNMISQREDQEISFGNSNSRPLPMLPENKSRILHSIQYIFRSITIGLTVIKRKKIRLIYARHGVSTIPAIFLASISNIPMIIEVNGILSDEIKNDDAKGLQHKLLRFLDKLGSIFSSRIIAVTSGIKKYFTEEFQMSPETIVVIPNGVNTSLFRPMNQNESRGRLGLDLNCRYILFIGSLTPWQGIEYLVEAGPFILQKIPSAKFLIVGNGIMKNGLIDRAKKLGIYNNFKFTGVVGYEKAPQYINSSNVCIVYKKPLKSGYSPLKLYEYMACGKPVVASKVEGFELLESCHAGVLVEPERPRELADAIMRILNNEELGKEMGNNGRDFISIQKSWDVVAQRIKSICETVLNNHNI
jgi:glycosyltransferase involved in cell wall biosynthesis